MAKFITNQNIELEHELASLGDRILAFIIDQFIVGGYFLAVLFFLTSIGAMDEDGGIVAFFIFLLPVLFYSILFETLANGRSPGKKARNIRVIRLDGGAPNIGNYLLRWIIRPVDILIYGAVAIVCIIFSKNGQRLGDILAGTTVVRVRTQIDLGDVTTIYSEDHEVKYPQVKQLSDRQIDLIRKALHMKRDGFTADGVKELSFKIKGILKITTTMTDVQFLYTIIKDYEYLMQEGR